jgi:2-oxoisovalerate dehydrogenase E1 component
MDTAILLKAYQLMCTAQHMAAMYEKKRSVCTYVHSTSRGHEAIQLAAAFQLLPTDYLCPYYRDESLLLGLGFTPYQLMLQLLAKAEDIFSGGRCYYAHPSSRANDKPIIIHQSSATGTQTIPATGIAQGIQYLASIHSTAIQSTTVNDTSPIVLCSLGDGSVTEGEVSEAFQVAAFKQLPIVFLVQDNSWSISATAAEIRSMDAYDYAAGFVGMNRVRINGSNFEESYYCLKEVVAHVRNGKGPCVVCAQVPLLGHHTSGVRKEFYREEKEVAADALQDPRLLLHQQLIQQGVTEKVLDDIHHLSKQQVEADFHKATQAPEPPAATVSHHVFAPTPITKEQGSREPMGKQEKIMMVDAALLAIKEIMEDHPEVILYGQDVGKRLGGVFREAATLAHLFGEHRVFNTAIQEAYIIGSTAGMSAVGVKPIVEIQFADYVFTGLNQLVTEISKSCYLSNGKFPIQSLIRIPIGAYGGGGPYHSGSIETMLLSIKGIKIVYPSNAADMKGLMKAAFYDPNPVVMLEHKGLYWSKMPGTEAAKTIEPARDYIIPLGKARVALQANSVSVAKGNVCCIITYGMGVYWALEAAGTHPGKITVVDIRCLYPLDEALIFATVQAHGKCLVITEEPQNNSFAEALAGRIANHCFEYLDAPVQVIGALNLPAVPMNTILENAMLPNAQKVTDSLTELLRY